jgi:hypothetical protein
MANFIHFENSHVFSKAPVQENMPASESVNKSVHTVQAEEIWADKCPFITYNEVKDLTADKTFDNFEGYAPVKFNYKKQVIVLTDINNNGKDSNGLAGKVFIEGKPINQFISETDATDKNGALAFGYRPILFDKDGGAVPSDNYTVNCSNGIIYFTNPVTSTAENCNYFLSFFTYEGSKLDTTITNIKDSIVQNKEELSGKIDKVETDYKAADTIINTSISNLSSELSGKIDKIETDYKAADTAINASITNLSGNISSHTSTSSIHVSPQDRELWNKGGNMTITGDDFIKPGKTDTGWSLSLNNSTVVGSSIASNVDGNKKVPTVNAVTTRVNDAITLHERNKNHLDFNQISFALSGGHPANKISNELKESSKYSFEYDASISASGINHTGLIVNNKSPKGLNAIFRKLTIKKVQPVNVSKLYAHIYKTSQRDITSGLLENGEYILTLEADTTTSGEITLNFGNELIISKEYYYGIKFTESEAVTSTEFVLKYNNFANVNYDPSASDPSYPSLITNKVVTDTVIEDITYNIPCIMEFENYEIPTSNAVKRYVDSSLVDPTMYLFPDLPKEDREYYMIFDAWQNPVYISEKFKKELTTGDRLFDYRPWEKFHIDMPYLETQSERMFHNNLNLISFKSDLSSLTRYSGFFHGDNKLQYVDIILTDKPLTDGSNCFTSCNKLKYVKLTGNNPETINTFLSYMPMNTNVKNKKLIIGKNENGKFVKYEKTDIPGDRLNSLIEAGWIFNN